MSYCTRHDWHQERIDCPQCDANTLVTSMLAITVPTFVLAISAMAGMILAAAYACR